MNPTKSDDLLNLKSDKRFNACLYVVDVIRNKQYSFINALTEEGMRCAIYCVAPNPDICTRDWVEFEHLLTTPRKSGNNHEFKHGFRMDELSTYARFTDGIKHKVKRSPFVSPNRAARAEKSASKQNSIVCNKTELGPNGEEMDASSRDRRHLEHDTASVKFPEPSKRCVSFRAPADFADEYVTTNNDEFTYKNHRNRSSDQLKSNLNSNSNFNSNTIPRKSCLRKDVDAISMHSLRFDDSAHDKGHRDRARSVRSEHISNGHRKDRTSTLVFEGVFERPFDPVKAEELNFNGERKWCYFNFLKTNAYGDILVCVPDSLPLLKRLRAGDCMHIRGRKWYNFDAQETLFVDDPHGFVLIGCERK